MFGGLANTISNNSPILRRSSSRPVVGEFDINAMKTGSLQFGPAILPSPILLWRFKVVSQYLDILHSAPISFDSLSYLIVMIQFIEHYVQALKCILKNSPNIKTLIIQHTAQGNSAEISDEWGEGLSLQNLKCVELHSYEGFDFEVGLLKGLLKKAMALEEMTIFTSTDSSAKYKRSLKFFTKNLMNFPRASTRVKILFRESEQRPVSHVIAL